MTEVFFLALHRVSTLTQVQEFDGYSYLYLFHYASNQPLSFQSILFFLVILIKCSSFLPRLRKKKVRAFSFVLLFLFLFLCFRNDRVVAGSYVGGPVRVMFIIFRHCVHTTFVNQQNSKGRSRELGNTLADLHPDSVQAECPWASHLKLIVQMRIISLPQGVTVCLQTR